MKRTRFLLAVVLAGCGGHRLHEIGPDRFPKGDYVPSARPASADPDAVRREAEEAFDLCPDLTLAGYGARLRRVSVFAESIRLEGVDSRGEVHEASHQVSAPLPRLSKKRVQFPPFYSVWDVVTRYSAEIEVDCISPEAARRVIDAVAALRALPGARAAQSADFDRDLEAYRAKRKQEPPEEALKLKAQAEEAVAEKRFDAALSLYERAADLAPWWPEGYFDRALMLGELGRFEEAIATMQRYLALEPEPRNVRDATDKIYSWEGKR